MYIISFLPVVLFVWAGVGGCPIPGALLTLGQGLGVWYSYPLVGRGAVGFFLGWGLTEFPWEKPSNPGLGFGRVYGLSQLPVAVCWEGAARGLVLVLAWVAWGMVGRVGWGHVLREEWRERRREAPHFGR